MVDKVKCGNKECKEFGKLVPVTLFMFGKIAPLDGPWPCGACGEPMKIAVVIPDNYKPGASKSMPRRITAYHPAKPKTVAKKPARKKSMIKIMLLGMGTGKSTMFKKQRPKSAGRKRVAGK